MELIKNKLIPSEGMHLKDINSGDIAEGYIFLGIYDSPSNYIEVTESEYQQYLIDKENEVELEQYEEH
jgi:hypothetical protein